MYSQRKPGNCPEFHELVQKRHVNPESFDWHVRVPIIHKKMKGCLEFACVCGGPCPFLHIYPSEVHSCRFLQRKFERKLAEEKKESKILPSKVHSCRFSKESCERKWGEKRRNPRSTIQKLFSPVPCQDSCAKLWIE